MAGCLRTGLGFPEGSAPISQKSDDSVDRKIKLLFDECVNDILKEINTISCYRPLPPLIGLGQEVDLFRLHCVVRNRGGFRVVSRSRLWGSVAEDCGFDSVAGAALKLVYVKYLETFDRLVSELGGGHEDAGNATKLRVDIGKNNNGDDNMGQHEDVDDDFIGKKRKRDDYAGMLKWVRYIAMDPCRSGIEQLPDRIKWKSYSSDVHWKKVLLVREAVLLKRNDAGSQQIAWQNQKMHPSMYDDDRYSSGLRCSQRLTLAKNTSHKAQECRPSPESPSDSQSDEDNSEPSDKSPSFWFLKHRPKRANIGRNYQAELPEDSGLEYQPDPKWFGTKAWPLEKCEYSRSLIERDPIGKGRQELCGCESPGSPECVKFHINEKRGKIKLELGPAFTRWSFDKMGEDVAALSWTKSDEDKFRDIVETKRVSEEEVFWDELFKFFPTKGREGLVSYYFNVYLLRRRSEQNRNGSENINSDDEGSEYGPVTDKFGESAAKSIFCSPKKSNPGNSK